MDIGLSDHRLLQWSVPLVRTRPEYMTQTRRPWRLLDSDEFHATVHSSSLCRPDMWTDLDVDDLAQLYDSEIIAILHRLIPVRAVTYHRRASDPWFDEECRAMKRQVRRLESAVRWTDPSDAAQQPPVTADTLAWTAKRRAYRDLLRKKREAFWVVKVDSERSSPRQS